MNKYLIKAGKATYASWVLLGSYRGYKYHQYEVDIKSRKGCPVIYTVWMICGAIIYAVPPVMPVVLMKEIERCHTTSPPKAGTPTNYYDLI